MAIAGAGNFSKDRAARPPLIPEPMRNQSSGASRRFRYRAEAARDRDGFRHLCAWEQAYSSNTIRRNAFPPDQPIPPPVLCPDKSLTALAQLAALRMNARTCMVSLCCRTTQYILADVTQQTPLQSKAGDQVHTYTWLGTSSFDRAHGLTAGAIEEWQKAKRAREVPPEPDYHYTQQLSPHCLIFSDIRSDARASKAELVRRTPWLRFYCSVPIRSGQGSVIGALTIFDDKPRFGVSGDELTLMEDLSDSVMEHLHATVERSKQERSARLLQGLTLFNAGERSMRKWWHSHDDARVHNRGRNAGVDTAVDRNARADREFGSQAQHSPDMKIGNKAHDYFGAKANGDVASATRLPLGSKVNVDVASATGVSSLERPLSPGEPTAPNGQHGPLAHRLTDGQQKAGDAAISMTAAYSRAANLMREAMDVEGIVLLNLDSTTDRPASPGRTGGSSLSDVGDDLGRNGNKRLSEVHGASVRNAPSADNIHNIHEGLDFPDKHLQRLIKRYPQGQIFHYDEDGSVQISSGDDSDETEISDERDRQIRRIKIDVETLGQAIPNIHSAGLYPLWDESTCRWRSCIFVWSISPARILSNDEDLAYLRTFGHSLLAELSRLESMVADQAKSTFIASISHELRSPLHGILAGAEFLNGTSLSAFQMEMTSAINVAGRVLLDTVDHVLEYSKMSSTVRETQKPTDQLTSISFSPTAVLEERKTSVVDLARLTEDIVETCVAAYRSQTLVNQSNGASPDQQYRGVNSITSRHKAPISKLDTNVAIALTIGQRESWIAEMHPGAWTRLVTNIVGNALKFTRKGHVSIRLLAYLPRRTSDIEEEDNPKPVVSLTVEDTGIGMSEYFLANGVFVPFKQEDPHTPGTGLGLSIVKQIAKDLNGKLSLNTTQGKGTKVTLHLPVQFMPSNAAGNAAVYGNDDSVSPEPSVDCFHLLPSSAATPATDIDTDLHASELLIGKSVMENAEDWLGCASSRTSCSQLDESSEPMAASVGAITEQTLRVWRTEKPSHLANMLDRLAARYTHLIILAESASSLTLDPTLTHPTLKQAFVSQPIGPAKLLQAIAYSASKASAGQATQPPGDTGSPLTTPGDSAVQPAKYQGLSSSSDGSPEPATPADPPAPEPLKNSDEGTLRPGTLQGYGKRDSILLVEDNDINMKLLVALVNKLKVPYQCALNGREAVTIYRNAPNAFFLVLMDINMPVMDGFAATAKLRDLEDRHGWPRTHISALTGVTDASARARAFHCGVDNFYSKPVKMRELKMIVDNLRKGKESGVGLE